MSAFRAAEPPDERADAGLDDARPVEDAERAADDEDVEDDLGDLDQAPGEGEEELAEPGRPGLDGMIGQRVDDLPAVVDDAVVAPGRDDPGRDGGQGDQADEQDVGVRDADLHRLRRGREAPGRRGVEPGREQDVVEQDALLGRMGQVELARAPDEGRDAGLPRDEGAVGPGREDGRAGRAGRPDPRTRPGRPRRAGGPGSMTSGPWSIVAMPPGIRSSRVLSPGRASRTRARSLFEVADDLLDRLRRHPAPVELDPAVGGDHARLLSAADRAHVDGRKPQHRVAPPLEGGDELAFDERDEMGRGGDGVDARLRRAAVGGPARELDLEPLQALVADGHAVLGRLADDGPVGLEPAQDERFRAEALHLLVDDRREGDAAGGEPARIAEVDEGPGHGRQGALHVHGAAPEHALVPDRRREEVDRGSLVGHRRCRGGRRKGGAARASGRRSRRRRSDAPRGPRRGWPAARAPGDKPARARAAASSCLGTPGWLGALTISIRSSRMPRSSMCVPPAGSSPTL